MSTIIELPVKAVPALSREELLAELRGKENSLLDMEQDLYAIAKAVWPAGSSEAPPAFHELEQFEVSEVVDGIRSLHELTDRLTRENEALQRRIRAFEVLLAYEPDNDTGQRERAFAMVELALAELDATVVVTPVDDREVRWAVVAMHGEGEGLGGTLLEAFTQLAQQRAKCAGGGARG